jgi:hypothetical protein
MILDLGDPPTGPSESDATADSVSTDTSVDSASADTGLVEDARKDAADDADVGEVDAGTPPAGNLLLYRASDGQALLVTIDASGIATRPRPFVLGAGFGTVAINRNVVLGYDPKKLEAHLFEVDWVTAAVTDLGTKSGGAPYTFSYGAPDGYFGLQITDYMLKNYAAVYRWNEAASTFESIVLSDGSGDWTTGIRIWDDHILLYKSSPAPQSVTYWGQFDPVTKSIHGDALSGPGAAIGPFWEKIAPLGPAGVLAVKGVVPTGRAWTNVEGNIAKDVTDLPSPIALLGATRTSTVLIHQGDSLVVGKLVPKADALSFEVMHANDTGAVAKSWTSMLVVDDP